MASCTPTYKFTEFCVTALGDLVRPPCLQDCIATDQTDFDVIAALVVLLLLLIFMGSGIYYFWSDIVKFVRRTSTPPRPDEMQNQEVTEV